MDLKQKILVIRFSSLGDIVLTKPLIDILKSEEFEIHYLTKNKFSKLLKTLLKPDQVLTISDHANLKELSEVFQSIKENKYNVIYDLHNNIRSRWISNEFSKIYKNIIIKRVRKYWFSEYFLFIFKRFIYNKLGFLKQNRMNEALNLIHTNKKIEKVKEYNLKEKSICISYESLWKGKEWGLESFIHLSEKLINDGYKVNFVGLKQAIINSKSPNIINSTGKTSIEDLIQILKLSEFTVSNDSGVLHLSEAVGTPVVGIFGPTTKELGFFPHLPESRVVEKNLWCRPCSKTGQMCFRIFKKYKCIKDIQIEQVYLECRKLYKALK